MLEKAKDLNLWQLHVLFRRSLLLMKQDVLRGIRKTATVTSQFDTSGGVLLSVIRTLYVFPVIT